MMQFINNYMYLIDINSIMLFEDISTNIDPKRINSCIKQAQDLDLALFMNDAFYYDFIKWLSNSGLSTITISTPATTAVDGTYTGQAITPTSGAGIGGSVTFTVLNGVVTSAVQTVPGSGFAVGDTFTCAAITGAVFTIATLQVVFLPGTPQLYLNFFNGCVYNDINGNPVSYQGLVPALAYLTFARFIELDPFRFTSTGAVQKHHDLSEPLSAKQISLLISGKRSIANAHLNKVEKFLYVNRASFPLWRYNEKEKNSRQPGARIRGVDKTDYNRAGYGSDYNYGFLNDLGGF
ncbi:MAG TPA: hypothetical protein VGN20_20580 [Mucilaginibacter sp.]|jgi:hypothetical protein